MGKPITLPDATVVGNDDDGNAFPDTGIPEETGVKGKDGGGSSTRPLAVTTTASGLPMEPLTPSCGLYIIIPGMPLGREPGGRVMRGWEEMGTGGKETCGNVGVVVVGNTEVTRVGEVVVEGDDPITHPETESGMSLLPIPTPAALPPLGHPTEKD